MSENTQHAATATRRDPRWSAVVARDRTADGQFFYSVATTGVYCRPSCASRTARPENVRFHATREDAERAGFRPCRRCRPDQPSLYERHVAITSAACRYIETCETPPKLAELARRAGLGPHHFHRVFKSIAGLTPKAYADACCARRMRRELERGGRITDAVFAAGYGSSSRFYEHAPGLLGMTASEYRAGGAARQIRFAVGKCSLGEILVACSDRGVCAIMLGDDAGALVEALQDRFPNSQLHGGDSGFERLVATVVGCVEAPASGLELPLDIRGTAFQQRVWQALRAIPAGETASYSDIARRIGQPKSARAVARACAANPLAVAIPCHRVVRNDGGLSGYRWGVERKRALLERETRCQQPAGRATSSPISH